MIPFFRKNFFNEEIELLKQWYNGELINVRDQLSNSFSNKFSYQNFFLTKSCTQSLELAILSLNLPFGKEVILPSYAFVSLANAVAINNLKCVFVDCDPNTMNISVDAAIQAITKDTAAIITINYGGISCDYDSLFPICKEKGIYIIEDNAHGIRAKYKDKWLGNFGDISTISFDFLKNISCNEGGGATINNENLLNNFQLAYDFGTNRNACLKGEVSFYEWKEKGTNAILAEHLAIILKSQLDKSDIIISEYISKWNKYYASLDDLQTKGLISLAKIPEYSSSNGHMFWLKAKDKSERDLLISYLKQFNIHTAFHYTPLHSSEFGFKVGIFRGSDNYTSIESNKLIRLPLYFNLTQEEQNEVIGRIYKFYGFNT